MWWLQAETQLIQPIHRKLLLGLWCKQLQTHNFTVFFFLQRPKVNRDWRTPIIRISAVAAFPGWSQMTAAHLSALTDLKHHQVLWMDTLMTRSCVRVQRVKSLISPGNRGKKAFNNVPMRPLGCTEQYNWKHNRAAAISFTWTLQQYKINFWCPRDPLLILRCVIKPSEAYEYRDTAHWLASYWKMCTRRNTRDCTSGSADVNKLLCGRGGIERVRGVTITGEKSN